LIVVSRVLIIEDDREISDLISIHLKDMDLEVSQSYNGRDGLLRALNEKFDLIILDIRLPYLDGLELCKRLRMEKVQTCFRHWDTLAGFHRILPTSSCSSVHSNGMVSQ